jgi:glycine cleavage system transcriptional repressor
MTTAKTYRVLTAVGSDRPGLVSEVSKMLHGLGLNIEDSRMAILGGEFALMLLVAGEEARLAEAERRATELAARLGLKLLFKATAGGRAQSQALAYRLQVTGLDHPGIVDAISSLLAEQAVNVAAMDTRLVHAPLTGTPTFQLRADLEVPGTVQLRRLREALGRCCEDDNLDFVLEARI